MKKFFILLIVFLFYVDSRALASGALFLDSPQSFTIDNKLPVTLYLDTGGASVNSVDVTLKISDENLVLSGYQDYKGLIKFWITPPKQEGAYIHLVGGIPGGVSKISEGLTTNNKIPLAVLLFEAKKPIDATIAIDNSIILQNDGLGSVFEHTRQGIRVSGIGNFVSGKDEKDASQESGNDTIPPVFSELYFVESTNSSETPQFIIFSATDEGSGIAYYNALFKRKKIGYIQSPFVVNKRLFPYSVVIEAYDIHGNKQTAQVSVPGIISATQWFFVAFIIIVFFGIVYRIKRRYEKK